MSGESATKLRKQLVELGRSRQSSPAVSVRNPAGSGTCTAAGEFLASRRLLGEVTTGREPLSSREQ